MAVDRATFVGVFPEFASESIYPNPAVTFWLGHATALYGEDRFGVQTALAVMLYAAHNLTLGAATNRKGGTANVAPVSSKSIDKLSVGYDTGAVTISGAGEWNATSYGRRLLAIIRAFGAGPHYRVRTPRAPVVTFT